MSAPLATLVRGDDGTADRTGSAGPPVHGRDYRVLPLDEASALLFLTGNHHVFIVSRALGARLAEGPDRLTDEERAEWKVLGAAALTVDVNRQRLGAARHADGANLAINVNLTAACNLSCSYCFANGGDYGRIRGSMQSYTLSHIFDFIRARVTSSRVVRFELFGGEPLLNLGRILELTRRADVFSAETGVTFIYRISTNLTVLPPETVELFRERHFIVSVSIDGAAETHNCNRPTKSGGDSYAQILDGCRRVRAVGDGVTLVARMTVVPSSVSLLTNVRALWALDLFDYMQIYPGVTPQLVPLGRKQPADSPYAAQVSELLREYPSLFQPGNRFRGVLEYERIAEMVFDGKMALAHCGAGGTYFTFSPDDSIMACHRVVGRTDMQVGTGPEGLTADVFEWTAPVDTHPVCSRCWARYVCGGNCRQENLIATGSLRGLNEETCRNQQHLLEEVIRMIARAGTAYRERGRALDDLFVSCGRPVVPNQRPAVTAVMLARLAHFQPISISISPIQPSH